MSTGNVVVTSPFDNAGGTAAGAVYLFNGATGALISTLIGSEADDDVGGNGVTALSNGNYVVDSFGWLGGRGAVTFGSGTTGISGVVSASNSLVGTTSGDYVGNYLTALNNGNYVVDSPYWNNGSATSAGAVTFGSGTTGISGVVSANNSLVGSTFNDQVGFNAGNPDVTALGNGNYVVDSSGWNNGTGAVSFGSGTTGISGAVSASNSLVGSVANQEVGSSGVTALSNGNYVVDSPNWGDDANGAVTFGSGTTGTIGVVSASNSLVGSFDQDNVGGQGVTALSNGNYVVDSPHWYYGAVQGAGAVTFGSGTTGISGAVSAGNSLVGSALDGEVGSGGVTTLSNGNYVVDSPNWTNGATTDVGAVTFASDTTGISGVVSASNSLVGSTTGDYVGGQGVTALSNGNYVVDSPGWNNGAATHAGAVTFASDTTGISGVVSASNSLVGSTTGDYVGNDGVTALSIGNFVVRSPDWHNGAATDAGAVTFASGTTGISGVVSASDSLVGSTSGDYVGLHRVTALSNGNYVVDSPYWNNGAATHAGAVTFASGTTGISGVVSASNSLVGSTANDYFANFGVTPLSNGNYVVDSEYIGAVTFGSGVTGIDGTVSASNSLVGSAVGSGGVAALSNGNYVVDSCYWSNGAAYQAGAVTFGSGTNGISGAVSASNSLVGSTEDDEVGYGGVTVLTNGNYVVDTPSWTNGALTSAGAVTFGSGAPASAAPSAPAIASSGSPRTPACNRSLWTTSMATILAYSMAKTTAKFGSARKPRESRRR